MKLLVRLNRLARSRPPERFVRQTNRICRAVQTARIILERRRQRTTRCHSTRFFNRATDFGEQLFAQLDGHAPLVRCVINCPANRVDSVLAQQQRVRRDLKHVRLFRHTLAFAVSARGTFLVIDDLRAVRSALNDVHHSHETERLALQAQAAQRCAFGKTFVERLCLFVAQPRRRIDIPMRVRSLNRVRVLLKDVFDPLVIKKPRAIDKIVQPSHRHQRLRFKSRLRLNRCVAHDRTRSSSRRLSFLFPILYAVTVKLATSPPLKRRGVYFAPQRRIGSVVCFVI